MENLIHKTFQFKADSVATEERNGVPVGILKGYASTWGVDRGGDQILKGAFAKTIQRHKDDNRQIRMFDGHDSSKLIGGYPINKVMDTDEGLYVEGEVNLQVQRGAEIYALAKQGVLTDFSVRFSVPNKNAIKSMKIDGKSITQFSEIELWEISPVNEPMNKDANILQVKSLELPIAPRETFSNSFVEMQNDLTFTQIIDGVETIIPKAVFKCASRLLGVGGSLTISNEDKVISIKTIESIYKRMNLDSPFGKEKIDITIIEACETQKDVEQLLKFVGISDDGRKRLTSKMKSFSREGVDAEVGNDLNKNASMLEMVSMGILINTLK